VFGSDYPYVSTESQLKELRDIGLSSELLQAIELENARILLNKK
jgi:predicted TIM-barrel fold metal-dependent hydrolase